MNSQFAFGLPLKLLERKYLASRIACLIFAIIWSLYLVGGQQPLATVVVVIMIILFLVQFFYQYNWLNWILGSAMFLLSAYFSLAVISEFNEFEIVKSTSWDLLTFGGGMCLGGFIHSFLILKESVRDFIDE